MANPPITIGPFDSVPAPGSPVSSPWAQEISQFVSNHLHAPWTPFTPVMRGNNVANVLGTGGSSANTGGRYKKIGTTCLFQLIWTFGTAGAVAQAGVQTFDLPVASTSGWGSWIGSGSILQGATLYQVQCFVYDNTRLRMSVAPTGDVSNTSPAGITFGNSYTIGGAYEIAPT